jgi:hypothetical protein
VGTASPSAICEIVDGGAGSPGTALKVLSNQNSAASDGLVFIHSDQALAPFTALNVRQDGTGDILNLLDGTTEVFTVLNGGNVGIGTASPAFTNGSGLEIQRDGIATLRIEDTGSSGKPLEIFSDDATGYHINGLGSGMPMIFSTVGTERMRILTGGGITFGGDTAAANALDDYEEGTWTIAVSSSDPGSMTATVSNGYGWYVKVGKVVHAGGSFDLSVSNGQGTMRITGLPYSCSSNGVRPLFVGQVGYTINVVPQPGYVTLGNGSSESYLDVWREGNNTRYDIVDWDSGGRMNFQITYEAA